MKVSIFHYPKTFKFEVTEALPPYEPDQFDNPERTEIFRKVIAGHKYKVQHAPDDFFVERVMPYKNGGEVWDIGS